VCNQLDDVRTRLLIAGGLMVAALVAVGIALALNGNPWTSAFGGAAAAGAIALGLLLGTIAAVVATQSALYDWYRCMTVRSGPVCHTQWLVALAALTAILAALAFQAAQVGSAIPISFIPGLQLRLPRSLHRRAQRGLDHEPAGRAAQRVRGSRERRRHRDRIGPAPARS